MGLLSNRIERSELKKGDHIYCYRKAHTFSHHGIYVGNDRVIHFRKSKKKHNPIRTVLGRNKSCGECGYNRIEDKGIVKTCVDCFLKHHRLFRFEYKVGVTEAMVKRSGTCSAASPDLAEVVIQRANDELKNNKEFGGYDFVENNCECFAFYCTTGIPRSTQANAFKDAIQNVRKTFPTGEHHSPKPIFESLLKGYLDDKIRRFNEESLINKKNDDDDDDDGSDQDE
ncbi:protein LEAD-SENSITIVE 1 [Cannabis sativa]|uniref:protein LEAD-SENSITIVE 1 n=1 Tax=Cannabis sativa TaxID=3483 RepID=UPI0029CA0AEB|nr:protein LEAD-SENSITIVE 1 [Cannabis sativa]